MLDADEVYWIIPEATQIAALIYFKSYDNQSDRSKEIIRKWKDITCVINEASIAWERVGAFHKTGSERYK